MARGAFLYQCGDDFHHLYIVRFGHFKTVQVSQYGDHSIGGFSMTGDVLGLEGIAGGAHTCSVVALETSEVCEVPFALLQEAAATVPGLLQYLHCAMSHEIEREQHVMAFRGRMRADQRLALFLLELAERYAARGYSSSSYQLRMSREDIGAYLGLTVESVSRQVARLRRAGAVVLNHRELCIADRLQLESIAAGAAVVTRLKPAVRSASSTGPTHA